MPSCPRLSVIYVAKSGATDCRRQHCGRAQGRDESCLRPRYDRHPIRALAGPWKIRSNRTGPYGNRATPCRAGTSFSRRDQRRGESRQRNDIRERWEAEGEVRGRKGGGGGGGKIEKEERRKREKEPTRFFSSSSAAEKSREGVPTIVRTIGASSGRQKGLGRLFVATLNGRLRTSS